MPDVSRKATRSCPKRDSDGCAVRAGEVRRKPERHPIAAHHLAHRRTRTDPAKLLIFSGSRHDTAPNIFHRRSFAKLVVSSRIKACGWRRMRFGLAQSPSS